MGHSINSNSKESYLEDIVAAPKYSSDWRFLPDIPEEGKTLIIGDIQDGFALPLNKNFNPLVFQNQKFARTGISKGNNNPFPNHLACVQADLLHAPFQPASFDLVAIPYGFPSGQTKAGRKLQLAYSLAAYRLTKPGGALYAGFANRRNFQRIYKKRLRHKAGSSLKRISRLLKSVGYTSMTFYGAIPDHEIPRYIFPLQTNTLNFVFHRHYDGKLPGFFANLSSKRFFSYGFQYLLPSYVVVAKSTGV